MSTNPAKTPGPRSWLASLVVTAALEFFDDDLGPVVPGDPLDTRTLNACQEAIANALRGVEDLGFEHEMDTLLSITISNVGEATRGNAERYALFVGSPYDSDYFGWGAYHNSYAELADAVADGEKLALKHRNGGAYHVVDLQVGRKVVDSR